MYKATIRIPTAQYAYIEFQVEGTPELIKEAHDEMLKLCGDKVGLDTKDWNIALDRYLSENVMDTEVYIAMSKEQQGLIQEIKRSLKRIEYNK